LEGEGVVTVEYRARCPDCGPVYLTVDQLRLAVGRQEANCFYFFQCPACGHSVRRHAGERIVRLLIEGGASVIRVHAS
jgi:ribosomal protein S27AE